MPSNGPHRIPTSFIQFVLETIRETFSGKRSLRPASLTARGLSQDPDCRIDGLLTAIAPESGNESVRGPYHALLFLLEFLMIVSFFEFLCLLACLLEFGLQFVGCTTNILPDELVAVPHSGQLSSFRILRLVAV